VDIFEVRGQQRPKHGTVFAPERSRNGLVFGYRGLDQVERRTVIEFAQLPQAISESEVRFAVRLEPREENWTKHTITPALIPFMT
jgi:glycogen debranching enzyme